MNPDPDIKNMPAPSGDPNGQPPADGQDPTPTVGGAGGGGKKTIWIWIIVIVLLLSALLFGWWWMNKDDKPAPSNNNSTSEQQTAEEAACAEGLTEHVNPDLGIGFCYPTEWGIIVTDARYEQEEATGERWRLSFADKPAVNLGMVSDDWSGTGREGSCTDVAVQTLPAFSPFSTTWETQGTPVVSATRGVEVLAGRYLIQESVDDVLNRGVCIVGYTIINSEPSTHTTASYYAEFAAPVTTPQEHIDSPNTLIAGADRDDFYAFVKSVHSL